jgi:hypothetical protein
VAILLLLIAAQTLNQWHMVAQRHEVCPVHFELVDADQECDGGEGPSAAASAIAASARPAAQAAFDAAAGTHADHHCPVATALSQLSRNVQVDHSTPTAVVSADKCMGGPTEIRALKFPLFRLAPKQSPPAA